jgi:hypothetical protein
VIFGDLVGPETPPVSAAARRNAVSPAVADER